ncbi:sigma-70 family RNA polymerase sigma factor [Treponema sp. OMZ 840]|uniref:sigma-70 family RNA polymerase sigma factor n=1 Tax=Treponema sp. OMZ 840 TaxID=244313 RepID=UPI003D8F1501
MEQNLYRMYINQIKKFPLLSPEQEKICAYKIQRGDKKAAQTLINANLRLVISIAFKYVNTSVPIMDIIQEGNMGLMTAVEKFNPSFNTRFSTYAYMWIVQHITRYIRLKDTAIPLPAMKEESIRMLVTAEEELRQHFHRNPTIRELALFLNMEEKAVEKLLQYKYAVISLEEKVDPAGEVTFSDLLPDSSESPETKILNRISQEQCENLIRLLPKRECLVLLNKYRASINGEKITLRQISYKLGISAEAVRQLEMRGRANMRKVLNKCAVL